MADRPVVILGAGASRDDGGPSLDELLPSALANRDQFRLLPDFVDDHFKDLDPHKLSLPLLLGFLDSALDRKHSLGKSWGLDEIRGVRAEVEFAIFNALKGMDLTKQNHPDLVKWLSENDRQPTIVSLNYDVVADAALVRHSFRVPEYGCDIATEGYVEQRENRFGRLYKLVGSLNWLFCPACLRLDVIFYKADMMPSVPVRAGPGLLLDAYTPEGYACPRDGCGAGMRPVMVTPTPMHREINPHIEQVRYAAERALQRADAAIFIGYSMRLTDLAIIYVLKRGLAHLDPGRITVVAGGSDWVHQNYIQAFGPRIHCEPLDFAGWMQKVKGPAGIPVSAF